MDWDNDDLETLVKEIDPTLSYEGFLGEGYFGRVVKVKKGDALFALKISGFPGCGVSREFNALNALNDIYGVPKVIQLYGDDAFLMELIYGETLSKVDNVGEKFFDKLRDIVRQINEKGYFISWDLSDENVMVGPNNDPWIIDFDGATYFKLPAPQEVFEESTRLVDKLIKKYKLRNRD